MKNRELSIAIIDYKMCNLFSVEHACRHVGMNPIITSDPEVIFESDGVILPGVGAFGDAIKNLDELGLSSAVRKTVAEGKPFMGICLGLQLLFSESEEFGNHKGLGLIPGKVRKFPSLLDGRALKVPQIGWNHIQKAKPSRFLEHINDKEYMYFVHSFYVQPQENSAILTTTNYEGFEYCSSIEKDNIIAFQFHPEKSAEIGIGIYSNWRDHIQKGVN